MNFVGVRFDPAHVSELLPVELKAAEGCTGTVCVYTAGYGWGIAPYTACFAAIEVKGFDSPDGSAAYYMAAGYFSDRAGVVMRRDYNLNFLEGRSRHEDDGDIVVGIGGPEGVDAMTIKARRFGDMPPATSGIHHYLGRNEDGRTNLYAVAFAGELWDTKPVSVTISDGASDRLKLLRPVELIWSFDCRNVSLTFSAPRPITDDPSQLAGESARASVLSVFTRLGRAAALVGPDAEIRLLNPGAEDLMREGVLVRHRCLKVSDRNGQSGLEAAITAAVERGADQFDLHPIAVDTPSGRPLIVQAMPIEADVAGGPSAVVLFSDPSEESGSDPAPALQLLGLTPAEARAAALVGRGQSPREAAAELDISEGTVRTELNRIYEKLAINRQSELARIVAKLESIGA